MERQSSGRRGFGEEPLAPFRADNFHLGIERDKSNPDSFIFFRDTCDRSRDRALADEALELLISTQAQHLLAATGRVSRPEIEQDNIE